MKELEAEAVERSAWRVAQDVVSRIKINKKKRSKAAFFTNRMCNDKSIR